jgi:DNA-binding NarL/FixJ family response regulator
MKNDNIRIAYAEDNAINRNTFLQKFEEFQNTQLTFVATNGIECLEKLKGLPENKMPQVIFMDLEMPLMDGIQTIALAHSLYPAIHFIVLTVFDDDDKIFNAIQAGASGYLLKHESAAVLQDAIHNALEHGGAPMSPAIARKTLQLLNRTSNESLSAAPNASSIPDTITKREKEILEYMVHGWDAKRIASVINISTFTVRKHIANIYDKLHINSKAQAMSLAHKENWFR